MKSHNLCFLTVLQCVVFVGCGIPKSSSRDVVKGQTANAPHTSNAQPATVSANQVISVNPVETAEPSPEVTSTPTTTASPTSGSSSTATPSPTSTSAATASPTTTAAPVATATPLPTATATPSNQSFIFNDDFNLANGLIDPLKWSKWTQFDLTSQGGVASPPFAGLVQGVVIAGNFTISADYNSLDSANATAQYMKFWAICGPQVSINTTKITGAGTIVYEGRINLGLYSYRNAELQMTDPSKALANQITKAPPGGYQAKTGKLGLYVGTDHAELFVNGGKKTTLNFPSRTGSCRIVLHLMDFTADNFEIISSP